MNSVSLIGKITKPLRFRKLEDGRHAALFTLATNEFELNEKGNPNKLKFFHRLIAWGNHVSILEHMGQPGASVAIEGRLVNRFFIQRNGSKAMVSEIEVRDLEIV